MNLNKLGAQILNKPFDCGTISLYISFEGGLGEHLYRSRPLSSLDDRGRCRCVVEAMVEYR